MGPVVTDLSVSLDGGVRLLDGVRADLERIRAVESDGVTHLWFRVLSNRSGI
jgi:hypothetical protein